MYLYLTIRSEPEKHLIAAECTAISGTTPNEYGIALTETEADVSRAAYIKTCMKVIVCVSDLTELYAHLEKIGLNSDGFRVSLAKFPRRLPANSQDVMHQIGARIGGTPDLSNPKTTFLVVMTAEKIWLGEVLSESDGSWNEHSQKAQLYSSALPTRLARAMVNLVAAPGDKIIDPCCGSGTILVEAFSIGIKALGCDINPKLPIMSVENLKHFGMDGMVLIADARNMAGNFDAAVTDLPYGRNCPMDEQLCHDILQNIRNLAPKAAVVTGEDISKLLTQMKYDVKKVIPIPKTSLTRYVHIFHV